MFDFLAIDFSLLPAFILAAFVICVAPGLDMAFVISRSILQGRKYGIATAFGIQMGVLVHILLAVLGLSAILMTSTWAFLILKYVGAAYLVYLGIHNEIGKMCKFLLKRKRFAKLLLFSRCTEIGLLVKPEDAEVPLFDTAVIHAKEAVNLAISKEDKDSKSQVS